MTNEPEAGTVRVPMNPFLTALLTFAGIGLVVWMVAGLFFFQALGDYNGDPSTAAGWVAVGGSVGWSALLIWLLASAITWKSPVENLATGDIGDKQNPLNPI